MNQDMTDPQSWLIQARGSLILAEVGQGIPDVPPSDVCDLAARAAAKTLRGVCLHLFGNLPETEELDELARHFEGTGLALPDISELMKMPGRAARAPGPMVKAAETLLTWAETVLSAEPS